MELIKTAFRELEAELSNEKEFNAANRRINAEYLVNILKKFLVIVDLSERERLVPVICSLLHIPADETQQIVSQWTVSAQQSVVNNYSGGVVVGNGAVLRWLLQPSDSAK